jgi:peptidoglycan/LPS O-acetylase OafA/YrhL
VLSGYLITSLLLNEYDASGTIDMGGFYWSRVRRLVPALAVMLFVVATFSTLFVHDAVASTWRDLPWAITGLSNWWLLFHQQSYFEAIGRPPLFQHTWSLAIETQFYVLWPLALWCLLRYGGKQAVGIVAALLAVASSVGMLIVGAHTTAVASESMSHLYFGTDTHSMGLFLGAALATVRRPPERAPAAPRADWRLEIVAVLSLVGLALLFHSITAAHGPNWTLCFPLCALLTALLIAVAVDGRSSLAAVLAIKPMRWIGERSYGMYLWHWPIFQATRPGIDFPSLGLSNIVFRLALTALVAEVSYRFVEMPVRRGALGRLWTRLQAWSPQLVRWVIAGGVVAIVSVAGTEVVLANRAISAYNASLEAVVPASVLVETEARREAAAATPDHRRIRSLSARRAALLEPVALVGDSVMIDVSPWLSRELRVVRVNAEVGRQAIPTRDVIAQMLDAGTAQPIMIVDLGNNGTVEEPTLRSILTLLKGSRVVIVNARVPRPWQDGNDQLMARVVPQYSNAVLADWYGASAGRPDFFAADGVHLTIAGSQAYARTIVAAIEAKADATGPASSHAFHFEGNR